MCRQYALAFQMAVDGGLGPQVAPVLAAKDLDIHVTLPHAMPSQHDARGQLGFLLAAMSGSNIFMVYSFIGRV